MMSTKSKYIIHIVTFLVALLIIVLVCMIMPVKKNKFLFDRNCTANPKNCQVEDYLNAGKIVVFGSSEVAMQESINQKYTTTHFFSRRNKPILFNGNVGFVSFGMLAQIISYYNKNLYNNARIVFTLTPSVFVNPGSYQKKINLVPYLRNYEFKRLLLTGDDLVGKKYKNYVFNYMKNKYKIKIPFVFNKLKFAWKDKTPLVPKYNYNFTKISADEYQKYYDDALAIEKRLDSGNNIGMHNSKFAYYKGHIPVRTFKNSAKNAMHNNKIINQEYLDFVMLVKFCKNLRIKPLFIMQDENFYSHERRDLLAPILQNIKKMAIDNGMGYLDLWTYKKSDLIIGKNIDLWHPANVSWVMIDKKIIDYFSRKGN